MNNPGMDMEIWKQLRQKWIDLDAKGHKIKVDFKLIADPQNEKNILAIDVVQHIDHRLVTETVQHQAGEAYATLGIAGLSAERLKEVFKDMMQELYQQAKSKDTELSLTMKPTSSTSGEVEGTLARINAPVQDSVLVNYRYYYVLNALRDKMSESTGKAWKKVRAAYYAGNLEFYFEYGNK